MDLFDLAGEIDQEPARPPTTSIPLVVLNAGSAWHEVPAALFLSWSPARQLAYCAARDEDSALLGEDAEWFRQRADNYREMMHGTT